MVGLFWVVVGGDAFFWVVVVGGGGYILAGGGWWWMVIGDGGWWWVVVRFTIAHFLYKLIVTQRFGGTAMFLCLLKKVFWKKSIFYPLSPQYHYKAANTKGPQQSFFFLKELRNCISRIMRVWSLFVQYGFTQVCIFYRFFWETSFLSSCVVSSWFQCNFHKTLLSHLHYIIIVYISTGTLYLCSNLFLKRDTRHKHLSTAFNKGKYSSRELLSFKVQKVSFIKENVKHLQTERAENAINKWILWRTFRK